MLPADPAVGRTVWPTTPIRPSGWDLRVIVPRVDEHMFRLGAVDADRVQLKVRHWIGGRKDEGNRTTMQRGVWRQRLVRRRSGTHTDSSRQA